MGLWSVVIGNRQENGFMVQMSEHNEVALRTFGLGWHYISK